jgi:hypothetical protein
MRYHPPEISRPKILFTFITFYGVNNIMPPEHSGKPEVQEAFARFFGRLNKKDYFLI